MDGLNQIYRDYGYNEGDLIVVQAATSWISINYWANSLGCEYQTVEHTNGGETLTSLFGNPSTGTMILVAPDKSYRGGLPERYGYGGTTIEMILEDASIENAVSLSRVINTASGLYSLQRSTSGLLLNIERGGVAQIALYSLMGRMYPVISGEFLASNSSVDIGLQVEVAPGMYILEVSIDNEVQQQMVRID